MTKPRSDLVSFDVDILETTAVGFTLLNRATGAIHTIRFDDVVIGPNVAGDGYELSLPRDLALLQEMINAA